MALVTMWLLVTALGVPVAPAQISSEPEAPDVQRVAGSDRIGTAVALSRVTFDSASTVVLVRADAFPDALTAGPRAAEVGGPVLLTDGRTLRDDVRSELERLGAQTVLVLGGEEAVSDSVLEDLGSEVSHSRIAGEDRYETSAAVAAELPEADGVVVATGEDFPDALAAGPMAALLGWPLLITEQDALPAATRAVLDERQPTEVLLVGGESAVGASVADDLAAVAPVRRIAGSNRYATAAAVQSAAMERGADPTVLTVATGRDFPDALAVGPAVAARGGSLLLVDGADLREPLEVALRIRSQVAEERTTTVQVLGGTAAVTDDVEWQIPTITTGSELPGGGFTLFPRNRMVAFYGNHSTAGLGVLGEQPTDAAYDRLLDQAEPYEAGTRQVLPTFELIVSVATAAAGPDGDYSAPSTPEQIQPWLDAARRNGAYLVLDLQSGRTDFLTEARRYEEFLRQPDVGLALDPEWRLDPGETPTGNVGEVDAAEVNAVAEYLSGLVREERLPQKLLVVHQFQIRMVENRDAIINPPELAVTFHMDGQGRQAVKLDTYRFISDDTGRWANGFKLFYDEDPDLFTPAEVLALDPVPDFISYQ